MSDRTTPKQRPTIALLASSGAAPMADRERALAARLGIPPISDLAQAAGRFDLLLAFHRNRLELRSVASRTLSPICVDFLLGATAQRALRQHVGKQPLAVAVGLRKGCRGVVDATAGLGSDAFMLAALGCDVTAVERCGVLVALLENGLARARADGGLQSQPIAERIDLVEADARVFLAGLSPAEAPDTIYLDPMFTPRRKKVAVNKVMQLTRELAGDDTDAPELLEIARRVAKRRVVVKRHHLAPPLSPNPVGEHIGKMVRYDVYLPIGK
ncbi:MAG: class I SAM-dependent methyltransferase [Phycisphaerae bacterium]